MHKNRKYCKRKGCHNPPSAFWAKNGGDEFCSTECAKVYNGVHTESAIELGGANSPTFAEQKRRVK